MFAKRQQMVFASAKAWYRTVREFDLRRPGIRIYPPKPKIGVRASEPNEIWHLDMSVFRLLDGTKVHIQGIIANASRYMLGWKVSTDFGGVNTKALIENALDVANSIGKNLDTFSPEAG
jgi:putative transposase